MFKEKRKLWRLKLRFEKYKIRQNNIRSLDQICDYNQSKNKSQEICFHRANKFYISITK